jgi:hypothetical protein
MQKPAVPAFEHKRKLTLAVLLYAARYLALGIVGVFIKFFYYVFKLI